MPQHKSAKKRLRQSDRKKTVITTGEIVKSFTLKQLGDYFKIDGKILLLKASRIKNKV